ncbi:MAG: ADP-ribosylglycohydrolase family protein [Verrucomicrobiota bacterium]
MHATWEQAEGGLLGLLVGDALGVPYEFHEPRDIPPHELIQMVPPSGFPRSYSHVQPGTWSDDGAQALCLLDSLLECRAWNPDHFASRLLAWYREGYLAVDGKVFDVGIQTGAALDRLAEGILPLDAGLSGERNNGNGSLMRTLPLVLLHTADDASLVSMVHAQSLLTHAHPRSQVCCALYALWARSEIRRDSESWDQAVAALRQLYAHQQAFEAELDLILALSARPPAGTGYVVDCLLSAKHACRETTYESIVRSAIAFGHDTDTTACVAGGIAGIRHGKSRIPEGWLAALRGREILDPLLERLKSRFP